MKRFNIPFVSQKHHLSATRELESKIRKLTQKLEKAEAELDKFRAAQGGACVPSKRCDVCAHCLTVTEHYGLGTYTSTACELTLPQCQKYQPK